MYYYVHKAEHEISSEKCLDMSAQDKICCNIF